MKNKTSFSAADVHHIAKLANIPITTDEAEKLASGFNSVLQVIDQLNEVDTSGVEPTHQVTGQTNITREDLVDEARMLKQEEALSNAKNTYNGYFVVDAILESE